MRRNGAPGLFPGRQNIYKHVFATSVVVAVVGRVTIKVLGVVSTVANVWWLL